MAESRIRFDDCFDREQVKEVARRLPATYRALNELAPWRKDKWPRRVRCMTEKEIINGRKRGAGHGYTYGGDSKSIWLNPHMNTLGLWLVFIHENLHHAFPDATEHELNNVLVPWVYRKVTGKTFPKDKARKAGIGPPEPGIGDRGYLYDNPTWSEG